MSLEAVLERIALALESRNKPVDSDAPAPKTTTKGKARRTVITETEKSGADEAEVVPPQPTGSTVPGAAPQSTAPVAASTQAVTPDPPAEVTKKDSKVTLEILRAAVQAYRAKKYPGDPLATEKVQEELFELVKHRRLGDIPSEDYAKVVEAFKVTA